MITKNVFQNHMKTKATLYEPEELILGNDFAVFKYKWEFDFKRQLKASIEIDDNGKYTYAYDSDFVNHQFVIINTGE